MINVIIADDHKIVVDGLVSILESIDDIKIIGIANNGAETLALVEKENIDIAIIDIEMPKPNGVELTELISVRYPNTKVLILSMYKTQSFVKRIMQAGARGYILKNKGGEELVKAIRYIHKGQSYIGQEITDVLINALKESSKKIAEPKIKLTKREKEVLSLIAEGKSSNEIGEVLFIASTTVDTHRRNLIDKIGVENSKQLIIHVMKNKDILL